ncbi:MAG: ATP-binding protein [Gammaproteobacteria bacterium]|nr:ATP-binding protein [Gammaproteobacteria bacterium]
MSLRWLGTRHDWRVLLLTALAGLPGVVVALLFLWRSGLDPAMRWPLSLALIGGWIGLSAAAKNHAVGPFETIANMLAALREGDFSIRARVGDARDSLSLAYLEINSLEEILREQRLGAVEATETLRKVLEEIDIVVLAFDPQGVLRIINRAGERLLGQPARRLRGRTAEELRLSGQLTGTTPRTVELSFPGGSGRWELRRSVVRQEGYPLRLIALSDLSRALHEEERKAWKRIIRVLSHEINNSLAPIKSISGSLRTLLKRGRLPAEMEDDVERGLDVISSRAETLGRFMASYARLARLPAPKPAPIPVGNLVQMVADLETRIPVEVVPGPEATCSADADQLQQALINLVRNAVDATLEAGGRRVRLGWAVHDARVEIIVEDEGPGLGDTGNLFVPFFTTKSGGSGVGLVLSRQIAESHGGTLLLENRGDGPGARARIAIPMDSDD